jgi:hypothetical protein
VNHATAFGCRERGRLKSANSHVQAHVTATVSLALDFSLLPRRKTSQSRFGDGAEMDAFALRSPRQEHVSYVSRK